MGCPPLADMAGADSNPVTALSAARSLDKHFFAHSIGTFGIAASPIAIHHSARDWVRLFGVLIAAAAAAQILVEDFAVAIAGTKELIRSHLPWPLGHIWISSPSGRTTAEQGEKEEPRSDSYSMTQTWTLSRRQQNQLAHCRSSFGMQTEFPLQN
jgi:hypothetical protein